MHTAPTVRTNDRATEMTEKMNQATRDFIRQHAEADVRQLALRAQGSPGVDLPFALDQIAGRQKARAKLPSWAATDGIVYPPHLSMEQCSSEPTARYKAGVCRGGGLLVDLTGGLGVDFAFMAGAFRRAIYVERQPRLCAIATGNFHTLGLTHAEVVCADAADYLRRLEQADLVFIDPARRDQHGGRTYGIADCQPNVLELKELLAAKARRLMFKLSPMLDWRKAVADLGGASEVHIVSAGNECKELLILVNSEQGRGNCDKLRVVCVNLLADGSTQRFEFEAGPDAPTSHSPVSIHHSGEAAHSARFLFEPNASVMKAGCFALLEERFGVCQADANSHLFIAERDVAGFPGRRFAIERATPTSKRELREALRDIDRANIAVRNFPLTAEALRRKLRLKDGGDTYIFATTVRGEGHQVFICRKIG